MADSLSQSRKRAIDAMYKAVLNPERYDPFIDEWTKHIATVAGELDDPDQAKQNESYQENEPHLLKHFERANVLMDRIGRRTDTAQPFAEPSEFSVSFNLSGAGIKPSPVAVLTRATKASNDRR